MIDLRIDHLLLEGFSAAESARVGAAIERELSRLFAERGIPPSLTAGAETPRLDAGSFELSPAGGAERAGRQIAGALYRGFLL